MASTIPGAIGDDVTDDTAAVQAWVNDTITNGYKTIAPAPPVAYRLTAPIAIPRGLRIEGDGVEPFIGDLPSTGTYTRGRGSWFHLDHAGVGFAIGGSPSISGVEIKGIGTFRSQPAPNGGAYTPGAFDYDFSISEADVLLDDVMLLNPTNGINNTNAGDGRLRLRDVRGQPLSVGINVACSMDTGRLRDFHFWPFWSNDTGVRDYMRGYGTAVCIGRWDNPNIDGCFAIGYAYFVHVIQSELGTLSKLAMSNCDADEGGFMLLIATGVNHATVQMSNCRTLGQNQGNVTPNFSNVQVNGNGCHVVMTNMEMRYPQINCVRVQGTGNVVDIAQATLGAWNQVNGGYAAIQAATAGNVINVKDNPTVSESPVGGASLYAAVAGSTINHP